jgi:PHD/YefM family antitoxin component YafN of YafNO toxin-antitoxin module
MTTHTATEARKLLYQILDEVAESHEPIQITGKRNNAILIAEDDWRAVQETLRPGSNRCCLRSRRHSSRTLGTSSSCSNLMR